MIEQLANFGFGDLGNQGQFPQMVSGHKMSHFFLDLSPQRDTSHFQYPRL